MTTTAPPRLTEPRTLNALLVDSTPEYRAAFLEQIERDLAFIDSDPRGFWRAAVDPGARFRETLQRAIQHPFPHFQVAVALTYVLVMPPARAKLHAKDQSFLDHELRTLVDHWLLGKDRHGLDFAPGDPTDAHVCSFVDRVMTMYRWKAMHA